MGSLTIQEKRHETVRKILDTAIQVFAELGFAGARIDDIAQRSGVNKATIYYRIGDKEALYTRVLHEVFADTAERLMRNVKEAKTPEEKLRTYIRNIVQTIGKNPYLPPIFLRELASGGRSFPGVVLNDLSQIIGALMVSLKEGTEKGEFIETSPLTLHLMVAGGTLLFRTIESIKENRPEVTELINQVFQGGLGNFGEEIENIILQGIKKKGSKDSRGRGVE
jgi:TetR/AcrR family transcriptional regulator